MVDTQHGGISLRPEDAGEGGLFDDVTVKVVKSRFEMFNYGGKNVAAPGIVFGLEDINDGAAYEQFYLMGNANDWTPSSDGTELVYVGSAENPSVRKTTNGMILITSVLDSGFPEDKFFADISAFENMVCHMQRVPAPKRGNLTKKTDKEGKEYDQTILVVDSIASMPWETEGAPKTGGNKGAPKAAAKKAKGAAKKAAVDNSNSDKEALTEKAVTFLVEQLAKNPDGINKKDLPVMFVNGFQKDKDRNKLVALVYKDEWLSDGARPFSYEDEVITL